MVQTQGERVPGPALRWCLGWARSVKRVTLDGQCIAPLPSFRREPRAIDPTPPSGGGIA